MLQVLLWEEAASTVAKIMHCSEFVHDISKNAIGYMEQIAVGVVFPSLSKFSSRRSRNSLSSLKKRGHSLEKFVTETMNREQGQYFSTADDEDHALSL